METCATCGEVIFRWHDTWVHGTDHIPVPADPEIPDDDTLIIIPTPEGEP
jgi:hypothetical protein